VYIKVALGADPAPVTLEEPTDLRRFHVAVALPAAASAGSSRSGEREALGDALTVAGLGHLADDGREAWIAIEGVKRLAAGRVGPTWVADFDAMVAYAASKGWLSSTGDELQAHVEWSS
jgi:hypothetical protein